MSCPKPCRCGGFQESAAAAAEEEEEEEGGRTRRTRYYEEFFMGTTRLDLIGVVDNLRLMQLLHHVMN